MNHLGINNGSPGWRMIRVRPATHALVVAEREHRQRSYETGQSTRPPRGEVFTLDEIIHEALVAARDKRRRSNRPSRRSRKAAATS